MNSRKRAKKYLDRSNLEYEHDESDIIALEALLEYQRQICADEVSDALDDLNLSLNDKGVVVDACLNATGENDE